MGYTFQIERESSYVDILLMGYFRHETKPGGHKIGRYLGGTALVRSYLGPINPLFLRGLDELLRQGDEIDHTQLGPGASLDALTQEGMATWDTLMIRKQALLHTRTVLAERRSPKEQIPAGGFVLHTDMWPSPGHEIMMVGDEFLGYVASPSEIAMMERVGNHVQALIVATEGPMPGDYL